MLEDRSVPATLTGLTATNQLITFDSATPQTITATVNVTGLQPGEDLLGIDYRPANGQLYGVGSTSRIYRIDPATGAATGPGGPNTTATVFTPAISGGVVGFDFNPVPDKIRLVTTPGRACG